jgi:hypothetical protein
MLLVGAPLCVALLLTQVAAPELVATRDLRVMEAVASTGSGVTRTTAGDVAEKLCFDVVAGEAATALAKVCMPRLPVGGAVCGDRACWVVDRSTISEAALVGQRRGLRGVPPPLQCAAQGARSPHVPEAFALAGLREGVDYVLACAYGHAAGDHRDVTPAGDDCGVVGDAYDMQACACRLQ